MIQRCSVDEELSPAVLHVQLSLFVIRSTQYSVRVHVRCTRSPTAALRHGYHRYESTFVFILSSKIWKYHTSVQLT